MADEARWETVAAQVRAGLLGAAERYSTTLLFRRWQLDLVGPVTPTSVLGSTYLFHAYQPDAEYGWGACLRAKSDTSLAARMTIANPPKPSPTPNEVLGHWRRKGGAGSITARPARAREAYVSAPTQMTAKCVSQTAYLHVILASV